MRQVWKVLMPAAVLVTGIWMGATPSKATPAYGKKEKKACTFCHVTMGKKDLNDAGKYYKDHDHSLEGYQAPKQ
jgi:hypothetical protein